MSAQAKLQYLDKTTRQEKLRTIESLISRLYAEWVIRGVLARMLPHKEGLSRLENHPIIRSLEGLSSSDKLAPAEIGGVVFRLNGKLRFDGRPTREWLAREAAGTSASL